MKTLSLILSISFFLSINLFSQLSQLKFIKSYEPGQIIKKNNDTINCDIELVQVDESDIAPLGEVYVDYKIDGNNKVQSIKNKEIKCIKAGIRTFQNITVDKAELFFKVVVYGKVKLLQYPRISIISNMTSSGAGSYKFGPPNIRYYAIETGEATYIIKQKKDIMTFIQIFEDCKDAKAMVESKSFKLEDLRSLVTNLNNCN